MYCLLVFLALVAFVWAETQVAEDKVKPYELGCICSLRNVRYLNASVEVVSGQLSGVYVVPLSVVNITASSWLSSYPDTVLNTKDIPYDPFSSCIGSQKYPVIRCEIGSDMPQFLVNPHEPVCMILDNRLQATTAKVKYTFLPTNATGQAIAASIMLTNQAVRASARQPLSISLLCILLFGLSASIL